MQLNFKSYQTLKTKQYFINTNFFFFTLGANHNSQNWIAIEQEFKRLKLHYYKIYNKTAKKTIKNSIYKNSTNMVKSTFFFIKPNQNKTDIKTKNYLSYNLDLILFTLLAVKINNKIYTISQLKNLNSFNYKYNMSIMYQFLITNLKFCYRLKYKNLKTK